MADKIKLGNLDSIIRSISPAEKSVYKDHKIVGVDLKTGELLEESFMENIFKKKKYYVVFPNEVARDVGGPEISIRYSNSPNPFIIDIYYQAKISDKSTIRLVRAIYKSEFPTDAINARIKRVIENFAFEHKDFVKEFQKYHQDIVNMVITAGSQVGLDINPTIIPRLLVDVEAQPFVNCDYKVITKTKDAQTVEIAHFVTLTLRDSFKYQLSGIQDIMVWVKKKLDQFTNNAIIEKTYADVLTDLQQSIIKGPMEIACQEIGYELKQIVTAPGLDIEKFFFETADSKLTGKVEYMTKDPRLKISLNVVVNGRLNLQAAKTKQYIKPGTDIIEGLKKNVIEFVSLYINNITPDDCFTRPFAFESNLETEVRSRLQANYGFKELGITIKFLENDLSLRLSKLAEKPKKVELLAEWSERKYSLWFRVLGVSENGWYRFRANNYSDTETELDDVGRMVKNGMESAILRTGDNITGKIISENFNKVRTRVREEYGLEIKIHDFNEELSDDENLYIKLKKDENEESYKREKLLKESETKELNSYLRKKEIAIETDESEEEIKKLDKKIESFRKTDPKAKFIQRKTDTNFFIENKKEDKPEERQGENKGER